MAKLKPGDPKLAIAYIRASKDEQKLSPEAQRASIEAWAEREGVAVLAWHAEHLCSVTELDDRPAFVAALADVKLHRAGVLVVAKRDRIARDVLLARLVERAIFGAGAKLVSAAGEGNGDQPADAFLRTIVDAAAEYERALIRQRTRSALAAKKKRGERIGTVPYGYRVAVAGQHAIEPDPNEQETIAVVHSYRKGGCTAREIVAELAERGIVGRTGKPLGVTQVVRILARQEITLDSGATGAVQVTP